MRYKTGFSATSKQRLSAVKFTSPSKSKAVLNKTNSIGFLNENYVARLSIL
jgi:hypothetical protein